MRIMAFRLRPAVLGAVCGLLCLGLFALGGIPRISKTMASGEKRPIYSVETPEPKVALGINCAWDAEDIPQLIELLRRESITATFFVVGDWCDQYPEAVKQLHAAGHEIGSHSDTHADMTELDRDGIVRELSESARKIEALTGQKPTLFRPPSGAYNTLVIETAEQMGFYPVQWDCDSIDYKDPSAEQMKSRILKKLRNGSIMLFHSGAANTPDALPGIIAAVREKGYEFVPVSELLLPPPYMVDFEGRQHPASASETE